MVAALIFALVQLGSGALTGVVRDQTGAAVASATVTIVAADTGFSRVMMTTDAGVYVAPGLAPGRYTVRVDARGFERLERAGVSLLTGEVTRLDLEVAVSGVTQTITVAADSTTPMRESATLGHTVARDAIAELPLSDRAFVTLSALAPGVALPPASLLPRINGGRPRTNEYLFDGISVLQPEPGQVAFLPVVDAIQEFSIASNSPPAEFGRFNGGVVNLTTKAGTNTLHGDLFEFLRHESLNARNFFASTEPVKLAFRRNQFGGVAGGPIARDRTFFFVDYQGQRQTIGRTMISTVPTLLQRQGIFTEPVAGRIPVIYDPQTRSGQTRLPFANNVIPAARVDPIAAALLQRYPLPTSGGTANNYQRTGDEVNDQDQFDVRIDHRLSSGGLLFARLSNFRDGFDPVTPLPDGSGLTTGTPGPQHTTAWSFASRHQQTLSDRLVNELRVGDTRRSVQRTAVALPTYSVAGYQQLGSPPNTATHFGTSVTEGANTLTWVAGRHSVKTGVDFRWERLNVFQPPSPNGAFQFTSLFTDLPGGANTGSALASFLLGQVTTFSIDVQQHEIRNRASIQEYFVQDDWKISDRLTLNLGTRYTLNFPSTEAHNQAAVFNLRTQKLDFLGQDGNPRTARELHTRDFGPRFGAVYRLGDRVVLSSGYGLVWIEQAGITTPFTTPVFPFLQTVSQRTLDNLAPAFVLATGPAVAPIPLTHDAGLGQGVFTVDRSLGSGFVQQWNVSLQRELAASTMLTIAYVGSVITHVGIPDANINQLSASQLALGPALLARVPNPFFGIIPRSSSIGDPTIPVAQLLKPYPEFTTVSFYRNNVGTTNYNGVEARLERRLSRGVSLSASYTRSKLVDDASSVFDASILTGPVTNAPVADSFNRALERDVSTGDIPNVFVSSVIWNAPQRWTLAAIVTLQSGVPVAVTQATNFNAFAGFGTQRPNLIGDPMLPADRRTPAQWFDTSAFVVAPQFTIGTSSRNPIRGPAYRNIDLAASKRIAVGQHATIEARAEVFNALNTPALGAPNAVLGAANFGTITTAGDPRVIQLAVKVLF